VTTVEVFAPAKINLTLHVTGQRADGYHLLDSLVVFAGVGDRLILSEATDFGLDVSGPEAPALKASGPNLIETLARALKGIPPLHCLLEKHLPISSGIGGGSADAAAFYRGATAVSDRQTTARLTETDSIIAQSRIGADIPMCILSTPLRARGIGEELSPLEYLPKLWAVLANPRKPVPTAAVFASLVCKNNEPMQASIPNFVSYSDVVEWVALQRNDLQSPAVEYVPVIGDVLDALASQSGCGLARMSGSGATCFGLFATSESAEQAAEKLCLAHPDWWVVAAALNGHEEKTPQVIRSTT